MNQDELIVQARARIIWGEELSSVRSFLTSKGMTTVQADATVKEFAAERNAAVRRQGLRNLLMGVALLAVAGVLLFLVWAGTDLPVEGYGVLVVAALYGMWKLAAGLFPVVRPRSRDLTLPDISE